MFVCLILGVFGAFNQTYITGYNRYLFGDENNELSLLTTATRYGRVLTTLDAVEKST